MKKACLLILLFLCTLFSRAQNIIGLPEIFNYSKLEYGGGSQNWDIGQDKSGIMYFANNEGLLSFDGQTWRLYPLPNKTNVRSLLLASDGKIYVGGQEELGYFAPDQRGKLVYHSLLPLISPNDRSFADVWDVVEFQGSFFFRSAKRIFQYSGAKIIPYKGSEWRFLGKSNNLLLAQDSQNGLLQFNNGFWKPLIDKKNLPEEILITSFSTLPKEGSLLTSLKHGSFLIKEGTLVPWKASSLEEVIRKQIYTSTSIDENYLALGTTLGGCYIINKNGQQVVLNLSRKEGLQNNNVLSVFTDRDKNLWLGLDNGIGFVSYNDAIRHIYPDSEKDASGYASIIYQDQLYLGTSNGLYKAPLNSSKNLSLVKGAFEPVNNTAGQVWNLSEVNGHLLLGHHEGSFLVNGNNASLIDKTSGFWNFLPLSNVLPSSLVVAGNYNGLHFFNYSGGRFTAAGNIAFESSRFVFVDGEDVWVTHPYKGIFKARKKEDGTRELKTYGAKQGLPASVGNYVFKIRNRIVATTEGGTIYEYNNAKDRFEVSSFFNALLGKPGIRYMKEDGNGNIWFVYGKSLGVIDMSAEKPVLIYVSELNNKMVSGFEHVYPVDAQNVFVGGEKGFYHINYEQYKKTKQQVQAGIRSVTAFNEGDSLLFGGYFASLNNNATQTEVPEIANDWNTFGFEFSSTLFGNQSNIEYSYRLKGFDREWSAWNRKGTKEYTNLPAGSYTFEVKARNNLGNESSVSTYSFVVLPPWYASPLAYFIYALLLAGVFYAIYRYQSRKFIRQKLRHEEEQRRLQYLHQLELEKNEKEIMKLRNEKLEAEINHKNTELASVAMHLVQKGELLSKIKEELVRIKKLSDTSKSGEDFKKIIKTLNEEEKMDEDWEHFAIYFDKVHSDFLMALKKEYPNLSPNELKLCAYLRMNLCSKEIAQLMNISVRGVEISRYRLRKKLQIPTEVNLFNFLMEFQESEVLGN